MDYSFGMLRNIVYTTNGQAHYMGVDGSAAATSTRRGREEICRCSAVRPHAAPTRRGLKGAARPLFRHLRGAHSRDSARTAESPRFAVVAGDRMASEGHSRGSRVKESDFIWRLSDEAARVAHLDGPPTPLAGRFGMAAYRAMRFSRVTIPPRRKRGKANHLARQSRPAPRRKEEDARVSRSAVGNPAKCDKPRSARAPRFR